jgi:putative oxidoreductase
MKKLTELSGIYYLRLALGLMFLVHGYAKLRGLFSGAGPTGMFVGFFGSTLGPVVSWAVSLIEFFGGIFLLLGLFTWTTSFLLAIIMAGAIILVNLGSWTGIAQHLVFLTALIAVMRDNVRECSLDKRFKLKY